MSQTLSAPQTNLGPPAASEQVTAKVRGEPTLRARRKFAPPRWTPAHDTLLTRWWPDHTIQELKSQLGFSRPWIRAQAKRLKLWDGGSKKQAALLYLLVAAKKRNMTPEALRTKIIGVVLQSRLIDAVLDDGDVK